MRIVGSPREHRLYESVHSLCFLLVTLLTFSIPLEGILVVPGIGSFSVLVGILAAAAAALYVALDGELRVLRVEHVLLALFVCLAAVSTVWSAAPEQTLGRFASFSQLWVLMWLVWQFADTEERMNRVLQAMVAASAVVSIALVYGLVTFDIESMSGREFRISSFGTNPNEQALGLAIAVPMSAYLLTKSTGLLRWLYFLLIPLLSVGVLITLSRGAFVALFVSYLSSIVVLSIARERRIVSMLIAGVLLVAGLILLSGFDEAMVRVFQLFQMITSGDLNSREIVWRAGLEGFPDAPWFGIGAGAYTAVSGSVLSKPWSPHSSYLGVLVETGIVGFLLLYGTVIAILIQAGRLEAGVRSMIYGVALPLAIGMLVTQWEYRKPLWLVLALAIGYSAVSQERRTVPD